MAEGSSGRGSASSHGLPMEASAPSFCFHREGGACAACTSPPSLLPVAPVAPPWISPVVSPAVPSSARKLTSPNERDVTSS